MESGSEAVDSVLRLKFTEEQGLQDPVEQKLSEGDLKQNTRDETFIDSKLKTTCFVSGLKHSYIISSFLSRLASVMLPQGLDRQFWYSAMQ